MLLISSMKITICIQNVRPPSVHVAFEPDVLRIFYGLALSRLLAVSELHLETGTPNCSRVLRIALLVAKQYSNSLCDRVSLNSQPNHQTSLEHSARIMWYDKGAIVYFIFCC
jgi:hypothetical protein